MKALRLLAWVIACVLAGVAVPAIAERPTSTVATSLPSLPGTSDVPLLGAIDGQTVVIDSTVGKASILGERGWKPVDASALRGGTVLGIVSDGQRSVLLTGADGVTSSVASVSLTRGMLADQILKPLPAPLRSALGAVTPDALVLAGIAADGQPRLFSRAWSGNEDWRALPVWPGGGAPQALAAQNGGIFVTLATGQQWRWLLASGWRAGAPAPGVVVAGSPRAIGQAYMLYLMHAGGGTRLYSYSAITDAWAPLGAPFAGDAVAAVAHGDGILAASRDGVGLSFTAITLKTTRQSLSAIDLAIIGGYLVAMLALGLSFYRRAKAGPSSEFFLGSRSIPFWAAGISMFAGSISSISYLAVPAKAYETNWEYIMSKMMTIIGLMFVAMFIVPIFRRLNLVSVFNYLETRFHPAIRFLSSALWILMQVGGRMGIVLYLPAMAIGTITDTDITLCIVVVGLFTIVYTALGGMRAVVWTDVFQVLVLTLGAFFAIGFVIYEIGFGTVVQTATAFDKTKMLNFSFDPAQPTVWAFLILMLFDVVLTFPKDQVLMQRVLATPSEKAAGRSVWLFAAVLLPSAFMFYIMGTVLFAYYRARPEQLNPMLPIDSVFPAFIGTELPHGIVGIIIAGLIAAAMGTLSGIINSVATLLSVDFYDRLVPARSQRQIVRFAEVTSVLVGLIGIGIAIILSRMNIHSLLDLTIELFGLLGGSCAGAYTLGLFTTRANWQGVAIGIVAASVVTCVVWWLGLIHPYLYLALAIASSIGIGYIASLFFPRPSHSLEGLTLFTALPKGTILKEPSSSTQAS